MHFDHPELEVGRRYSWLAVPAAQCTFNQRA